MSKDMNLLASRPLNDSFQTYSQKIETNFQGYFVNPTMVFEPSKDTQVVSFKEYISLLLTKDKSKLIEDSWIFEGQSKFLDGEVEVPKLTYATYPRSGNSFFRKYFESITGISTGNDIECKYLVNLALQMQGFKGQEVVDDKVWIVKTHYPDGFSVELDYKTNKVILCVRNPLDVLASQFSFLFTWTHSKSMKEEFHTTFKDPWEKLVKYQIHKWAAFHRWWIKYS
jgi:hypothetical protein